MCDRPAGPGPPRAPVTAPAYRWLHLIGEGAFGEVWAAERDGDVVAVKVVRAAHEGSPVLDALRREIAVARRIAELPGVVVAHGVHDVRGVVHLEMELVRGPNLEQVLEGWMASHRKPLPTSLAVPWMVEILETLHDAGSLVSPNSPWSFVHRDVKPANVLLDPTGRVRLTDFGVARALDLADVQTTTTGVLKGTPRFMSPEVARGAVPDGRADQFSVGALLLELVTGRRLYEAQSMGRVLAMVARAEVGPALAHVADEDLRAVIARLLARDPAERFPSRADAATALSALRTSGPPLSAALPELLSYAGRKAADDPDGPELDAATDAWERAAEQTWDASLDTLHPQSPQPVVVEAPPPSAPARPDPRRAAILGAIGAVVVVLLLIALALVAG